MTRLSKLTELVQGSLQGDGALEIEGAAPLAAASSGQITLVDSANSLEKLSSSAAAAVVIKQGLGKSPISAIEVADPHAAFSQIIRHFRPARPAPAPGIQAGAHVEPSAKIDPTATIYPFAYIGEEVEIGPGVTIHSGSRVLAGCRVGEATTIHANVVLYEDTVIGPRCTIHAGTVLGANGFGYSTVQGRHLPAAQLGSVVVGSDVEIGACSTVDRGAYGPTTIGDGTKIDNHVMIAHNCQVGKHNLLCSQVGIAGSVTTGDYVVMAGQVGIKDHVKVGTQVMLGAKAGVIGDIPAGGEYVGIPATPQKEQFRIQAALARLPELRKQVKELERTVERLEAQAAENATSDDHESPRQEAA